MGRVVEEIELGYTGVKVWWGCKVHNTTGIRTHGMRVNIAGEND